MGHSFGSISVTEVLNRKLEIRNSVAGLITSGSKNNIKISSDIQNQYYFCIMNMIDVRARPTDQQKIILKTLKKQTPPRPY